MEFFEPTKYQKHLCDTMFDAEIQFLFYGGYFYEIEMRRKFAQNLICKPAETVNRDLQMADIDEVLHEVLK